MKNLNFAIIGMGNIGRILARRLLAASVPAHQIVVVDADEDRAQACAAEFGVCSAALADESVAAANVLLLSPGPKAVPEVLQTLSPHLSAGQIVLSFAAATPLARLELLVPAGVAVVRVMPNAPSLTGQGMNPVAFSAQADEKVRQTVHELLAWLGETIEVRDDQMNWCVGLTGAAMRSLLPVLEGMTRAGMDAGFSEADSRRMAAQVTLGTAALTLETDMTFEQIKALTPMETVDEAALADLFFNAAQAAQGKITSLQNKLWPEQASQID